MIDMTYFGSAGLFSAMILGIVVPAIYAVFIKRNITIKMPDGVPPFVSKGFAGIIPVLCITILFVIVRQLCALTPFGSFDGMIYGLLKAPLASLSESRSPSASWSFCAICCGSSASMAVWSRCLSSPCCTCPPPSRTRCVCSGRRGPAQHPHQHVVVHLRPARRVRRHHRPCSVHALRGQERALQVPR